jgi:hypothetical protein
MVRRPFVLTFLVRTQRAVEELVGLKKFRSVEKLVGLEKFRAFEKLVIAQLRVTARILARQLRTQRRTAFWSARDRTVVAWRP